MQLSISLRPRTLSEVYGQDHITKALVKRTSSGEWPNAILLKGMTGTGKTSVAQIIAMTINCEGQGTRPCGHCASCLSIIEERFDRDTHRLDGSSSSKDDVIDFSTLADVSPMYDDNSVFIIEETDQLSPKAKNALLKLIEKPLKNVYFILLSMVPMGVPPAIATRCQTFNFRPFTRKDVMLALRAMLVRIGKWDSPDIPKTFYTEVLSTISDICQGSLRSAVQYMETCLASDIFTATDAKNELGIVSAAAVNEMLVSLLQLKTEFFAQFENVDIQEFFNLAYTILSTAAAYKLSNHIKNEYFEEQAKALSKEKNMFDLLRVFDDIGTKPYLKKNYMVSQFAQFYTRFQGEKRAEDKPKRVLLNE